jgi:hypothetical protein
LKKLIENKLIKTTKMEKQKRTRRPNLSTSDYLEAFKKMKMEIDINPKVKTSKISKEIGISNVCVAKLKQLGIINETAHGLFWSGIAPTSQMVNSVKSLFNVPPVKKTSKTTIGTSEPKNLAPQGEIEFKESESIIDKHWNESIKEWNTRVSSQIAEKTQMLIQDKALVDSSCVSDLIEYDTPPIPKKERQKRTTKSKERIFELKIFGLVLFTIKY